MANKLISYKSSQDRIKYYDDKLHIHTIFFRAHHITPVEKWQKDFNKYSKKEKEFFIKDKNMKEYILMNDAEHFIWKNQIYSDKIIEIIKKYT